MINVNKKKKNERKVIVLECTGMRSDVSQSPEGKKAYATYIRNTNKPRGKKEGWYLSNII